MTSESDDRDAWPQPNDAHEKITRDGLHFLLLSYSAEIHALEYLLHGEENALCKSGIPTGIFFLHLQRLVRPDDI